MMKLVCRPIGIIHTPFDSRDDVPIQAAFSQAVGSVEIHPEFAAGLADIDGFSHVILLYWFHESDGYHLTVRPFLDREDRGLFATRYPARPNAIGISTVDLLEREENRLRVRGVDVLNGTPLLDLKPFAPVFDHRENVRIGWLAGKT